MKVSRRHLIDTDGSADCAAVIAERRRNPTDKKDLLNIMLFSKDPKTGESLSDVNIRNNVRRHFSLLALLFSLTGSHDSS